MFMMPGGWEWLVIFAVILIVFGPKRLPEIGKQVGKGMRMFRDASREIQNHLNLDEFDYTPPRKPPRRVNPPVLPNRPEGTTEGTSTQSQQSTEPSISEESKQEIKEESKPDGYPREEDPMD